MEEERLLEITDIEDLEEDYVLFSVSRIKKGSKFIEPIDEEIFESLLQKEKEYYLADKINQIIEVLNL